VAVASAYDHLARAWDEGAGLVYRPLARLLVRSSPAGLAGWTVLDAGSGTGAVAQAATAVGASVVVLDRSPGMLSFDGGGGWPAVKGDALDLPFGDGVFDGALAGFLINHFPPASGLAELARVVQPGGVVLATTWAGGDVDPVKAAVDSCSFRLVGWRRPGTKR
jgi:demethylmenaquinone methyltransferase/2-methoxy-6-polyprenyl-1,4-benzoquinol methylase